MTWVTLITLSVICSADILWISNRADSEPTFYFCLFVNSNIVRLTLKQEAVANLKLHKFWCKTSSFFYLILSSHSALSAGFTTVQRFVLFFCKPFLKPRPVSHLTELNQALLEAIPNFQPAGNLAISSQSIYSLIPSFNWRCHRSLFSTTVVLETK